MDGKENKRRGTWNGVEEKRIFVDAIRSKTLKKWLDMRHAEELHNTIIVGMTFMLCFHMDKKVGS